MALAVEGFENKAPVNPFNYTEDEICEKKLHLLTMKNLYPHVSPAHADMIYDMCKNNTPERIEELKKLASEPFKYKDMYKTLQEELDRVKTDLTITIAS